MKLPTSVTINEVGLRDGLQLEDKIIATKDKVTLVEMLNYAGVDVLEFGSFVLPKLVPQMADTKPLFEIIRDKTEQRKIALIPNYKGAQLAYDIGVKEVNYVFSISNTHNEQNVRKTTEESLRDYHELKTFCDAKGMKLNVTLSTVFGCPFEGEIKKERVLQISSELIERGVNVLTYADTTGMANPRQVADLTSTVLAKWPNQTFGLHFHNTRGMGLSNILAGVQEGITLFDTALGGLGGCPFAPGATGNVCTEDVVHMFEEMDVDTGIDITALTAAAKKLRELVGHELPGQIIKAGVSSRKYPVPNS